MTSQNNPPLPQPPFFQIQNINNLRDAALFPGVLPTSTGGKVRPGILFRSAETSKLDVAGWKAIKGIGIGRVFDLRSKPEIDKGWKGITREKDVVGEEGKDVRRGWLTDMEAVGIERDWVPIFEESDYSPERLAERYLKYMGESVDGFVEAYKDILQHAGPSFRTIFLYLASIPPPEATESMGFLSNDPQAPIPPATPLGALIHCTAGKDRTGIFFGLLFSFLGVPKEKIADEYNLTEMGLRHIRGDISSRLMYSPGFREYALSQMRGKGITSEDLAEALKNKDIGNVNGEELVIPPEILEKGKQAALRMVGARKESMLGALEMIEAEWGSAEKYMRTLCGLEDKELEALRRNLVVPV